MRARRVPLRRRAQRAVEKERPLTRQAEHVSAPGVQAERRGGRRNLEELRGTVRDQLSNLLYRNTKRSPMILPIIQEV